MCLDESLKKQDELIESIRKISSDYYEVVNELKEDVKEINGSICDSYHFIELNDLDVVRGYRAYKDLQTKLKTRRKLKNNITYINSIANEMMLIKSTYKDTDKKFEDPQYCPRINDELFQAESPGSICKGKTILTFKTVGEVASYLQTVSGFKSKRATNRIKIAMDKGTKYCGYYIVGDSEGNILLKK